MQRPPRLVDNMCFVRVVYIPTHVHSPSPCFCLHPHPHPLPPLTQPPLSNTHLSLTHFSLTHLSTFHSPTSHSSTSHSSISLPQTCAHTGVKRTSRLFLADLGGSEQVKKSLVDAGVNRTVGEAEAFSLGFQLGEHMREAVYINLGLLALKKCIEALNNDQPYVPYQDSKLTMLLSSGLGDTPALVLVLHIPPLSFPVKYPQYPLYPLTHSPCSSPRD